MKLNEKEAYAHVASINNKSYKEVKNDMGTVFFSNLDEVFEFVYEGVSCDIILDLIKDITIDDMKKDGVKNPLDCLVINWDHLYITPYGYVKYEI